MRYQSLRVHFQQRITRSLHISLILLPTPPISVCVTTRQSVLVSVIPGVLSGFVLLLLVVVLVCQIVSFMNSIRRRKGYLCIKPINVS